MERIVKVGQYVYHLGYSQEGGQAPVIEGIDALSELILFDGAIPIPYERLDSVQLADAARLTVDMEGKTSLMQALVDALNKIPKSNPRMLTV